MLLNKTILVTGGAGSIGCGIVEEVLAQGAERVIVFSRDEIKHFLMKKRISDKRLETIVGDVRNLKSIDRVFRNEIDIIYHAAAMKHVVMCEEFPIETVETNAMGTQNVVDLALKYRVPKMITISTDKVTFPTNVMGATKLIAEKITLNANRVSRGNQAFACVRFGNVANSRGSVIPVYIDNLFYNKPLEVTNPKITRFIMKIADAVKLVVKATEYAQGGEIFVLKMKAFNLKDLVDVAVNRIAPRLNIGHAVSTETTGLESGEKLHEDLISSAELSRTYELDDMYLILPDDESSDKYPSLKKASITDYTSHDAELISKDEIEALFMDCLKRRQEFGGV